MNKLVHKVDNDQRFSSQQIPQKKQTQQLYYPTTLFYYQLIWTNHIFICIHTQLHVCQVQVAKTLQQIPPSWKL